MAPTYRKHWKAVYQAKQNLYGVSFKGGKKKWSWSTDKNGFSFGNSFCFKFEKNSDTPFEVVNTLPKSLRFLSTIRREYGTRLRAKQAAKAAFGLIPEKRFKTLINGFK